MASFEYGGLIEQVASTATAAGTTTLTNTSKQIQIWTGTNIQTIVLPDATTFSSAGAKYEFYNNSTGALTINMNGGTNLATVAPNGVVLIKLTSNGSSAGSWTVVTPGSTERTFNTQSGTTYTFVLSDGSEAGGNVLVTFGSASATTVTIPTNASVAFPIGTQIDCTQLGAGKVTFSPAGGVTVNSKSANLSISAQYVAVSLVKTATNTWSLIGDLVA